MPARHQRSGATGFVRLAACHPRASSLSPAVTCPLLSGRRLRSAAPAVGEAGDERAAWASMSRTAFPGSSACRTGPLSRVRRRRNGIAATRPRLPSNRKDGDLIIGLNPIRYRRARRAHHPVQDAAAPAAHERLRHRAADYLHRRGADFTLPAIDNSPACPTPSTSCPGSAPRSPTPPPTATTAGSKPAGAVVGMTWCTVARVRCERPALGSCVAIWL